MSAADAILVERTLAGDRSAFEVLVADHLLRAQALARAIVQDPHAVDDVVQEAFLKAYRQLGGLAEPAYFPTWLGSIVRNEAVTWLRRHAHRNAHDPALLSEMPAPSAPTPADPRAERLQQAMAALKADYREVLLLKYQAGLTYEDLAETLGLSLANVEKRLYRARLALAELLDGSPPA